MMEFVICVVLAAAMKALMTIEQTDYGQQNQEQDGLVSVRDGNP